MKTFLHSLLILFIVLVVSELIVRFYLAFNLVYDVEMSRYSIELKQVVPDSRIAHLHKPNKKVRLMGTDVVINSDGFRDKEYPIVRSDRKRIVLIGDSITFGWGVDKKDIFENILEDMLNQGGSVEVINMGVGNHNTEQQAHHFITKGLKYAPDRLVVFYFINDAEETPQRSKFSFLGYSSLFTLYWSRFHILAKSLGISEKYSDYYSGLYQNDKLGWIKVKESFKILKNVCDDNKIDLRVVIIPEMHNLNQYPFKREHSMVMQYLDEQEIRSKDLTSYFNDISDSFSLWVSIDDAHPNKKAHQLIANHSFEFVGEGLR